MRRGWLRSKMVSFRKRGDLHGQSKENPRRSACGGNRRKRNYSGIDAAEEKQPENSGGYSCEKSMDYATVARWWADTVKGTGVSLYIGMADYLAGNSDPKSPWYGTTAIERQLALNDTLPQVAGEAHFRYRLMAENPELLALYAEAYGEESQEPAEPAYLNTREHDAYIQGNDGRFRPEDSLSRAEAVAMLARLSVDEQGNLLYSGAPGTG